jgi:cytoskeletal protein CcmA (bactofilin family)
MVMNALSKMSGELILTTDTRIDGKVLGKVESERNVIIGTTGYVKGFLRANNLVVFGRIEGNFIISGTTIFHPGSSIFGNLYTKVLEVKEGAFITAHIKTYLELNTFDEAQIFLAEEMLGIKPNRMNIPAYSTQEIIFDNNIEFVEEEQKPVYLMKGEDDETLLEHTAYVSDKVSPNSIEQPEEPLITPKRNLSSGSFHDLFTHEPESIPSNYTTKKEHAISCEPYIHLDEITTPEPSTEEVTADQPVTSSELVDTEGKLHPDGTIFEHESNIILETLTAQDDNEIPANEQIAEAEPIPIFESTNAAEFIPLPEPIATAESISIPDPIQVQKARLPSRQSKRTKAASKPVANSALVASPFEQSAKKVITLSGSEMTKPKILSSTFSLPKENKTNGQIIFNLGELSNLLNRPKNTYGNLAKKVNGHLNGNLITKVNKQLNENFDTTKEDEEIPNTNNSEKKSSFLTNSIKELTKSNYSSIFH